MKPAESLAVGFLVMSAAICMYSIIAIILYGDALLGLLYLMILSIPLSFGIYWLRVGKKKASSSSWDEKLCRVLFALQGAALACWAYDLATTFYAINVTRIASEINPLGWPLGAVGAFAYYAPTVMLAYVLLFKMKATISHCAAVPMTVVMILMGSMNLSAGAGNFTIFIWTTSISVPVRLNLLALVVAVDLVFGAILLKASAKRFVEMRKVNMTNKV